jgi:small subunit ribosomal protein S16
MSLRIRLALHGPPHRRIFHLVAIGLKKRRNAKPTELLGIYNPHTNPKTLEWGVDRIKYWLDHGAQPSKSAVKLLEMVRLRVNSLTPGNGLVLMFGHRAKCYHRIPNITSHKRLQNYIHNRNLRRNPKYQRRHIEVGGWLFNNDSQLHHTHALDEPRSHVLMHTATCKFPIIIVIQGQMRSRNRMVLRLCFQGLTASKKTRLFGFIA